MPLFALFQQGKRDKVSPPPALRQITILRQTGWHRIQDEMNGVDKEKERLREAAKRREALHLQSKEIVKRWPDTIVVSVSVKSDMGVAVS